MLSPFRCRYSLARQERKYWRLKRLARRKSDDQVAIIYVRAPRMHCICALARIFQ
jgi:hypothetical protein